MSELIAGGWHNVIVCTCGSWFIWFVNWNRGRSKGTAGTWQLVRGRGTELEHHLPVLIHCQSSGALSAGGRLEKLAGGMCSCLHGLLPKFSSRLLFSMGKSMGGHLGETVWASKLQTFLGRASCVRGC